MPLDTTPRSEPIEPSGSTPEGRPTVAPGPGRASARRRLLVPALAVIAAIAAGVAVAPILVSAFRPHLYTGTVFQGDTPAPSLDGLVYADGSPADLADFDDRVVLVFFGYANCPDVCPGTLSRARLAVELLGEDGDDVEVLLVGVDPERDSPADLEAYVDLFDPRFRSASGQPEDVTRVAALYGVYFRADDHEPGGDGYLVDHTASLLGIDRDGALRIVWAPDVDHEHLAADLRELIG